MLNATGDSVPAPTVTSKKPLHVVRLTLPNFGADAQRTGPTLSPVYAIHRGPDGFVPFAAKPDGTWKELGAVNLAQPYLPELVTHLDADAYFGLNSSFTTGTHADTRHVWRPLPGYPKAEQQVLQRVLRRTVPTTGLPYAKHQNDTLRWLNVCHVDIDCYKRGFSQGEALGYVVDLQDAGDIPPATAIARSGRGLWLLWFLVDGMNPKAGTKPVYGVVHQPDTPQRATVRAVAFYAKLQRALADKLTWLGADLGALDAARFAPVPGTMKRAVNRRVEYWLQVDGNGRTFAYTLASLARALGVPVALERDTHPVIVAALPDVTDTERTMRHARALKGWRVRWQRALGDFRTLLNLRGGGFDRGQRNRGAYFYALMLARAGMAWGDVAQQLDTYAARCRPPLTADEVRGVVRQAQKPKGAVTNYLTNATWQAELDVTDTEASYLQTRQPKAVPSQQRTMQARRDAIRELVYQLGRVPSPRAMAKLLQDAPGGFSGNFSTVWRDYDALGLNAKRRRATDARGGRPPKLPY